MEGISKIGLHRGIATYFPTIMGDPAFYSESCYILMGCQVFTLFYFQCGCAMYNTSQVFDAVLNVSNLSVYVLAILDPKRLVL